MLSVDLVVVRSPNGNGARRLGTLVENPQLQPQEQPMGAQTFASLQKASNHHLQVNRDRFVLSNGHGVSSAARHVGSNG